MIEGISFVGRFLGTLTLIIMKVKRQKLAYTVFGLLQIAGNAIIASAHIFPEQAKLFFIVGMAIFGFARGVYLIPFVLASQFFDP